ncbi:hypothetical protein RO3G_07570 [Rhizopus delemar RA 99-880]|uniref:Uncharacterized protein n=1 Tax=Rhizopus delemar (strain RA 99-880 / ATCC MYA-4621 / FGSC 9543 / NRRL 43880) TaxID=246409 RepID=I1C335_RHIO9|nr:hypothetical protein RO3G_07570 [Rhizopus delemar RA 99-880]|eukprot:EIE82865.1 hypothetical protein RO3G_07570 [Rhizopus delemar RA 99-880]
MIKTLSDKYQYAPFEVLKKLKLHFIHVHGKYDRAMVDNVDTPKSIIVAVINYGIVNYYDQNGIATSTYRREFWG